MFGRIVLLIIFGFVFPNSHSYPVGLNDEDVENNAIDSGTSLIDTENYDYLDTSAIDDSVVNTTEDCDNTEISTMNSIDTTTKDKEDIFTTAIPQKDIKNQNSTVIFRTLKYDGPVIVEKIEYVKIAKKIPIHFRLVINDEDNIKDNPLIIESSTLLEDFTTTDSSLNVFLKK